MQSLTAVDEKKSEIIFKQKLNKWRKKSDNYIVTETANERVDKKS